MTLKMKSSWKIWPLSISLTLYPYTVIDLNLYLKVEKKMEITRHRLAMGMKVNQSREEI